MTDLTPNLESWLAELRHQQNDRDDWLSAADLAAATDRYLDARNAAGAEDDQKDAKTPAPAQDDSGASETKEDG